MRCRARSARPALTFIRLDDVHRRAGWSGHDRPDTQVVAVGRGPPAIATNRGLSPRPFVAAVLSSRGVAAMLGTTSRAHDSRDDKFPRVSCRKSSEG